jgi:hypothetical protein
MRAARVALHAVADRVLVELRPVREGGPVCAAEPGPDDQEQQHGGCVQGEDGRRAEHLGRQGQVLVGDGREARQDGPVEGKQ